ncbi:AAA family ATPase, partial [Aquipuribacter hungaricus]
MRRPAAERRPARGRVVTVFSAKGGSGTTTFCTNLAAALADGGRRSVVLVDLDLSLGDVAIALNLFPVTTLADAPAPDGEPMGPEALRALLTPHSPGLSALLAPAQPGRAASVPVELVESVLEALRHAVDHVVVDTPTALDAHVLAALEAADTVVLLAALEIPALKHLKITLETLEQLGLPEERWRVVLNRSDSDVGLAVREVERTLGWRISGMVPSSRDVPLSVNRGVPLVLEQPRHPVSQAVREFAGRELVGGRRPSVVDLREPVGRASARPGAAGPDPRSLV